MPKCTRREFAAAGGALLAPLEVQAEPAPKTPTDLLSRSVSLEKVASMLEPRERWGPFPGAADRAAWEALPAETRQALIAGGERALKGEWPALPATLFLEFRRTGNRSNFEGVQNARRGRLRALAVAECAEGKGRFLDEIANGIWTTCEESFWGVPAHMGLQKAGAGLPDTSEPVVDLFAAETAAQLAWTDYLLGAALDKVSPLIRPRIRTEVDRRVLTPAMERSDFWWMGFDGSRSVNNWNPWINSNWLTANLLLETDSQRRAGAVYKIIRSLDAFLAVYHDDGGCDEGPSYWGRAGGSLFDCLELLYSATDGKLDYYGMPLVREIGRYIYRAHIHNDWFVNFADAPARVHLSADLVFRYGRRIGDEKMRALGAFAAGERSDASARGDSLGRQLPALFNLAALRGAPRAQPLVRDAWLSGIQVAAARRKEGSAEGLYLAAKGGHNAESHNHNDVGNFIVYADGKPAIIDVGVETYTAKTFSAQRYDIWTMQSAYHNLPTVGGVMQAPGRQFAARDVAYRADDRGVEFRLDIAKTWPAQAGVESWTRTMRLDREANRLEVEERYALRKAVPEITLTLMTPSKPVPGGAGKLALGPVNVQYDGRVFEPRIEEIPIEDGRLRSTWGERLYRVLLAAKNPPARGAWTVRITS